MLCVLDARALLMHSGLAIMHTNLAAGPEQAAAVCRFVLAELAFEKPSLPTSSDVSTQYAHLSFHAAHRSCWHVCIQYKPVSHNCDPDIAYSQTVYNDVAYARKIRMHVSKQQSQVALLRCELSLLCFQTDLEPSLSRIIHACSA